MTESVVVTSAMVGYGKEMSIVLAPILHGAQFDGVQAGKASRGIHQRVGIIARFMGLESVERKALKQVSSLLPSIV